VAQEYTIVDVRSPGEFAEGHVPGSLNLPLLDDAQRAAVGRAYNQQGAQAARMLAMDLVTPRLPAYLRSLKLVATRGSRLAVMCWRGGERSRNVVLLLALIGVRAERLEGGYKAYRRMVIEGLQAWRPDRPVATLYGLTGSGKTALLRRLSEMAPSTTPRPSVVDLEGLALHRGSLLGGLNQPSRRTQKDFESRLWDVLRKADGDYLLFEGEGAKIGHLLLPENVAQAVRGGVPVHVHASVEQRAATILSEYAPSTWSEADVQNFGGALTVIGRKVSGVSQARLRERFASGRHAEVVEELLVTYYDPLYRHSSVDGREFALTLMRTTDDQMDAESLARELPCVVGLAPDSARVGHCVQRSEDEVACSR
jgi:tRNA 2-selenouridine synthase